MKLFSYLRKDTLGLVRKYFICLCRKKKKKTQVIPYSKQTIYQNIRSVSSHWWNLKHFIYFKPEDLGFWIWNKGRYFFFFFNAGGCGWPYYSWDCTWLHAQYHSQCCTGMLYSVEDHTEVNSHSKQGLCPLLSLKPLFWCIGVVIWRMGNTYL